MPRQNAFVKVDKDLAEAMFGHRRGRPTISRRAGEAISRATGVSPETGTAAFHVTLIGAALIAVVTSATREAPLRTDA